VIPVTPGDYAFHVYGTINGENVDETFTPGPETFSSVEDRAALEFPSTTAGTPVAVAGATGGISRSDVGGGLAVGLAALAALAATAAVRRRPILRPLTHGASAGD
jgi:hypothetical protein